MHSRSRGARRGGLLTILAALTFAWPAVASAQDPNALRARLEQLQRDEATILEQRNWWLALFNDPDRFLFPRTPPTAASPINGMPRVMTRAQVQAMAERYAAAAIALSYGRSQLDPAMIVQWEQQDSDDFKSLIRRTLIPQFERDLETVRSEFQRLMAQRTQPGESPRVWPGARAWYFRRPVVAEVGAPDANHQLLDQEATERGGYVQVRYRVNGTCWESWQMQWTFEGNVSRLQAGMRVPVSLQVQLVSAPCPSGLGSYLGIGAPRLEDEIQRQAPSDALQAGVVDATGDRAEANGVSRAASNRVILTVNADPGQSNAWTLFRLYAYTPGKFWVIGYLYLAGGS